MAQQERWQMSGSGPELYEHYMVPAIFAPWAAYLVEQAALQAGERVLDAACGTGIVARLAAQQLRGTGRVVGLDLNPGMIALAGSLSLERNTPIEWREGNLEALPFTEGEFDVVLCQQGLQFCADRAAAVRQMRRVLRPEGRLLLSVWRELQYCPYNAAVVSGVTQHVSATAGKRMSAPCSLGNPDELRALLTTAGFADIRLRIHFLPMRVASLEEFLPGQFLASPIAGEIGALDAANREQLFTHIKETLRPYMDDKGLTVPFEAYVALARTPM
jgi:ubiquinone/menaquinone biosynthesis C-methylase UbiE